MSWCTIESDPGERCVSIVTVRTNRSCLHNLFNSRYVYLAQCRAHTRSSIFSFLFFLQVMSFCVFCS
jgi:hypothetical protein